MTTGSEAGRGPSVSREKANPGPRLKVTESREVERNSALGLLWRLRSPQSPGLSPHLPLGMEEGCRAPQEFKAICLGIPPAPSPGQI